MIYYLILIATGIIIDFKDLKDSKKKSDIIFYVISMVICVVIGVFYFTDTTRSGIAEIFVKWFGLGGF